MRTIAECLALPYHDRIVRSETTDGQPSWFGTVDELRGLTTSSLTLDDMEAQLHDAKQAWFEAAIEVGMEIPEPHEDDHSVPEYSGRLGLRIAKGLHRAVAERAALEGISLTQFASNVLAGAVGYGTPAPLIGMPAFAVLPGRQTTLDPNAVAYGAAISERMRFADLFEGENPPGDQPAMMLGMKPLKTGTAKVIETLSGRFLITNIDDDIDVTADPPGSIR